MSTISIARPSSDEAAAPFQGYIAEVTGENIGDQLKEQLGELDRLLATLDDTAALSRYAPGKWSVKEVVGHLTDTERIFTYRLLRIARADSTPLPGFDENAYVPAGNFDRRPLPALVEEFRRVRLSTIALVEGLPPDSWTRQGQASGRSVSARALVYIVVGHLAHHLGVLRGRYGLAPKTSASATV